MSIYIRTKSRFGSRITEWLIAAQTFSFGVMLLSPSSTYDTSPMFFYLKHFVTDDVLGWVMVLIGASQLTALVINGAMQNVTPTARAVTAFLGFMTWTLICFSFALSGIFSTWVGIYPFIAAFELVNVYRATHDAGEFGA